MEDGRKNNGGHKSAGRKSKADEEKVNTLFANALKELYNKETTYDAKKHFITQVLLESQRGQLFVAEHLFGKAPQEVKQTNLNIDAKDLTPEQIKIINEALENEY